MNQWVDVKWEVDSNLSWQYVNKDDQGWCDPKLKCMHLIRENLMVCYGLIHPADLWLKKAAPFPFFYFLRVLSSLPCTLAAVRVRGANRLQTGPPKKIDATVNLGSRERGWEYIPIHVSHCCFSICNVSLLVMGWR